MQPDYGVSFHNSLFFRDSCYTELYNAPGIRYRFIILFQQ